VNDTEITEKNVQNRNYLPTFSFQTVLPSKAIRNEKIMDTLMLQANLVSML